MWSEILDQNDSLLLNVGQMPPPPNSFEKNSSRFFDEVLILIRMGRQISLVTVTPWGQVQSVTLTISYHMTF